MTIPTGYIRSAAALLLLAAIGGKAPAQSTDRMPTPEEYSRVNEVARRFSDRLLKTKDIGPLIDEFFLTDFLARTLQNDQVEWGMYLDKKIALTVSRRDLKRYFIGEVNWYYLCTLYASSRPKRSVDPSDFDAFVVEAYPKDMARVLRSDPQLRKIIDKSRSNSPDDPDMVSTLEDFRLLLHFYEKLWPMLRRDAISAGAGTTKAWKKAMAVTASRYYHPQLQICDAECSGLPQGSKKFTVNIPILRLDLISVNGQVKILQAILNPE